MITLRRTGERPLSFQGAELCNAMSYVPGTPLWYEINVYRTAGETFVANVRMYTRSENEKDRFSCYEASSFDEVLSWLESYDPADDIRALPLADGRAGDRARPQGSRGSHAPLRSQAPVPGPARRNPLSP